MPSQDEDALDQQAATANETVVYDGSPPSAADAGSPKPPRAGVNSVASEASPSQPTKSVRARTRSSKSTKGKAAKKAAGKRKVSAETTAARQAKFPRHPVERALRIPQALYEQNGGRPATLQEAVRFTGGTAVSGGFRTEVSSAKKYGFLESADNNKVALTDRARKAISPQSPNDRVDALREGVLAAPDLSNVYSFYRGENLPDQQFLVNALTDRFAVPADKVGEFLEIFDESLRAAKLIDESGPRPKLVDIGRDENHRLPLGGGSPAKRSAAVPSGTSCFVMQPFLGPLGGYYESIYKPAIEQAGLQPLRADAEIFGTGKIMDQIWRGIHSAQVLVAELTSKNPNVFYELGLAHALEKPVVLVSSNQEDVPFDLRHIRVILYDQTDPFWGEKLINKLADNLRSALADPEETIFRIDGV
jgi:hypothetical protein